MKITQWEIKCSGYYPRGILGRVKSYAITWSKVTSFSTSVATPGSSVLPSCGSDIWGIMEKDLCSMWEFMWDTETERVKGSKLSMRQREQNARTRLLVTTNGPWKSPYMIRWILSHYLDCKFNTGPSEQQTMKIRQWGFQSKTKDFTSISKRTVYSSPVSTPPIPSWTSHIVPYLVLICWGGLIPLLGFF